MVAAALGLDSREVALAATCLIALVHGLLLYAIRRLQRAAYEPPVLRLLDAPQETA